MGNEARDLDRGEVTRVAEAVGAAAETVWRGRDELDDPLPLPTGRSRGAGGGRKCTEVLDPALAADLDALVEPEPAAIR